MNNNPTMRVALDEVFKTNFSVFDGYDDPVKKEQIAKLNYIETIAHQLEKNLQGVNLFDILPNNNNIILATEGEINNVLIGFNREKYFDKPEPEHVIVEMTPDQVESIEKLFLTQFERRKRDLQGQVDRAMNDAVRRMRDHQNYLRNAAEYRQQIEEIKVADSTQLITSLNQVFADKRFQFIEFRSGRMPNDSVDFLIKDDIILTHKNERAGIGLRVNLGKMKIRLMFRNGLRVNVLQHENNLMAQNFYHPHLDTEGTV